MLTSMIFRFLPILLLLYPSNVLSEVGYRDLKIGGSSELINKYCKETIHYNWLVDENVPSCISVRYSKNTTYKIK